MSMYWRGSLLDIPTQPDVSVPLKSDVNPAGAVCVVAGADVAVVDEAQTPTRAAPVKNRDRCRVMGYLGKNTR
jgi:hypothetical protein